jgi:hypothetical protein
LFLVAGLSESLDETFKRGVGSWQGELFSLGFCMGIT